LPIGGPWAFVDSKISWHTKLALSFKLEVYRIVEGSKKAMADFKYKSQLYDAASSVERNIGEGFGRYVAAEFAHFLAYALASLKEAKIVLKDGVHRKYFQEADCAAAFSLADRCGAATMNLHQSLRPFFRRRRPPPPPARNKDGKQRPGRSSGSDDDPRPLGRR
jgi:four helix bundle protein